MITLSPQQEDIMDWVDNAEGSAFVEAVAGAGKTTVLVEACTRIKGTVSLCAFNKKIATEIADRLPQESYNIHARTFHAFGNQTWKNYAGRGVRLDDAGKRATMIEECHVTDTYAGAVTKLVSLAKNSAVGLLWEPEDTEKWLQLMRHHDLDAEFEKDAEIETAIKMAQRGIKWSREEGMMMIDFDDMIWLPTTTKGVRFYKKDWVLVDEAQDTNAVRRVLAAKLLKPGGRMLWVGDRNQAIYGFTGADADAVDQIIKEYRCTDLPLTITYRCPKSVVKTARQWVSHIQAHESAPEGKVQEIGTAAFDDYYCNKSKREVLTSKDAVLCRNTRPLVSLAFSLLRRGIACHVEGRDIGKNLINLATKWKRVTTTVQLCENLEAYLQRETTKLLARGKDEYTIDALTDKVETLISLTDGVETIKALVEKIDKMFKDTNGKPATVTLSTVHKAKGREWDRVFIIKFDTLMPSRYAKKDWQRQQETNLMYVAATRAKKELFFQVDDGSQAEYDDY